jgi:hypothetical protein
LSGSVDYFLIAVIAFASSFFGAFGKEFADLIIKYARKGLKTEIEKGV